LALAPLLFVKVIVARYQKSARGVLTALGIAIFAIAFTLVALNVSTHYLRQASAYKARLSTSITFVAVALLSALIAYFGTSKRAGPKAHREVLPAIGHLGRELGNSEDVLNLILARIEPQTHDAKTLRFLLPQGKDIATRPGQFLTFEWMIDEKPVARSYTICSSPACRNFIDITPKRMENGCVSRFLNDRASIGLNVKARGPYGRFYFDESEHKRIVLIAAGSGITPMIAMLRYIDDLCISTDATLIYCIRTIQDAFFKDELEALQRRLMKFRCVMVLSQPRAEWTGWKGRLRREILQREVEKPSESTFFLCGPPGSWSLAALC
jgi:cytochrome-b5 reductase